MFSLPNLTYAYDALEPFIDARTMELHHSKHHQTYVDKVNGAIKDSEYSDLPIEQLMQQLEKLPDNIRTIVRNNGGGHYNHSFFWEIMAPASGADLHDGLTDEINKAFGSFVEFKEKFAAAAVGRFGSGWVWLIKKDGKLEITDTPNQDSPIMEGVSPILGLDVWEHAYYLKYQNRRPEYIDAWWNVVNWQAVNDRFAAA